MRVRVVLDVVWYQIDPACLEGQNHAACGPRSGSAYAKRVGRWEASAGIEKSSAVPGRRRCFQHGWRELSAKGWDQG